MTSPTVTAAELRERGFSALVAGLGWVNAVRYLQLFEQSNLDYTKEREWILPNWDLDALMQKYNEHLARHQVPQERHCDDAREKAASSGESPS